MNWSRPIDLYCERTDPSFWAEPVNALSNIAFVLAALAAFVLWRRRCKDDLAILALIITVAAVGLGSFAFHTLATRGALLLDIGPIGLFIYGYFLLALRRFLKVLWPAALGLLAGFMVLSNAMAVLVPREVLTGAAGYFPALAALVGIGWLTRGRSVGRALLAAGGVFAVSLILRIADPEVCGALPLGTHFFWHILNAIVLYTVLRGTISERRATVA